MAEKIRLDLLLVQKGLAPTRETAQRVIQAGQVYLDGRQADKPGQAVPIAGAVEVRGSGLAYVSRGGEKLAGALADFGLPVTGLVCADLGASTGGFTDCLLQRGAEKVYAVDVGRGQLTWKLRQDPRVKVLEEVNARYLKPGDLPEEVDLATIDVSFISLRLILPAALGLLKPEGEIVALIKPQFEAGREKVGKHGVVREPETHRQVLETVLGEADRLGLGLKGLTFSPLQGPQGNIEFFGWWGRGAAGQSGREELISRVILDAHRNFAASRR